MTKHFFGALLGALALAVACGGGSETGGGEGTGGGEEVDLSAFEGPVGGDASAGETVFANMCEGCHSGGHESNGSDDLHTSGDSPAEARMIIRQGSGRMPAFGSDTISDEDLENLLAHLQSYGMFQ